MKRSVLYSILAIGFLFPAVVFADVITPLSYYTLPLLAPIILVELFILWFWCKKRLQRPIGFWKALLIVLIANVVTSALGTIIPLYKNPVTNLLWVGGSFVVSVLVEWVVYILFLKKFDITKIDLLKISFVANLASYILIIAYYSLGL